MNRPGVWNAGRRGDMLPCTVRTARPERTRVLVKGEALLALAPDPECAAAPCLLADVTETRLRCCPDGEL